MTCLRTSAGSRVIADERLAYGGGACRRVSTAAKHHGLAVTTDDVFLHFSIARRPLEPSCSKV